ncbi:6-phosphofructo-2-kinase [Savitreella phatthalungensis]
MSHPATPSDFLVPGMHNRPIVKRHHRRASSNVSLSPPTNDDAIEHTRFLLQKTALTREHNLTSRASDTPATRSTSATPAQTAPNSPRLLPRAQTLAVPGVTRSKISPDGAVHQTASKLVIVMVGLPARGKSYIVKKLARYFNWQGHQCRIFNCGDRRRRNVQAKQDADFFDVDNESARQTREKLAMETLESLVHWIVHEDGTVGIFDATNSTRSRRNAINRRIAVEADLKVLYLESICTDSELLEANMRLKLGGPDYRDMNPVVALKDFKARVRNYERAYETIGEEEERDNVSFCKMINVGKKIISHNIMGFLASQAVGFLLNFNLAERLIFITRHGESQDNVEGRIGGDAPLTPRGRKYAAALARLVDEQRLRFRQHQLEQWRSHPRIIPNELDHWTENPTPRDGYYHHELPPAEKSFSVWTSSLSRSKDSAMDFDEAIYDVKSFRIMDEINSGIMERMTYAEIQQQFPREFASRQADKLHYRYPGVAGESYLDVVHRLNPIIVETERAAHHILMISHRVISRILLSYFLNLTPHQATALDVPLEVVYCIVPRSFSADLVKFSWDEKTDVFVEEVIVGGQIESRRQV